MRAIIWVIRGVGFCLYSIWEFLHWAVLLAVIGVYLGFFLYVGFFAARGVFPDLIPWVQGLPELLW